MAADGTPFMKPLLSTGTPEPLAYDALVSYSKGASMMAMLEAYWQSIQADAFRVCTLPLSASV